jgi:hypothetical protein
MAKRNFRFGGKNLVDWLTVGCMVVVLVLCVLVYVKVNNEGYSDKHMSVRSGDCGILGPKHPEFEIPNSGWTPFSSTSDGFVSSTNQGYTIITMPIGDRVAAIQIQFPNGRTFGPVDLHAELDPNVIAVKYNTGCCYYSGAC